MIITSHVMHLKQTCLEVTGAQQTPFLNEENFSVYSIINSSKSSNSIKTSSLEKLRYLLRSSIGSFNYSSFKI
jgi:hypothetical protein